MRLGPSKGRLMRSADTNKIWIDRLHLTAWRPRKQNRRTREPKLSRKPVTGAKLLKRKPD